MCVFGSFFVFGFRSMEIDRYMVCLHSNTMNKYTRERLSTIMGLIVNIYELCALYGEIDWKFFNDKIELVEHIKQMHRFNEKSHTI